jgi:uncharacterized membrane protein YphA (DoxX/SURF4 family)
MKEALGGVLTDQQAEEYGPVPLPIRPGWLQMSRLDWIDFLVRWGLVVSGTGLILGMFTRTSCLIGAGLLLSFYLATPPLPGAPEALRVEGYPFINKNLVEMFVLLMLATTSSGRWAGVDAFLYWLNPWRRAPQPQPASTPGASSAASPLKSLRASEKSSPPAKNREAASIPLRKD